MEPVIRQTFSKNGTGTFFASRCSSPTVSTRCNINAWVCFIVGSPCVHWNREISRCAKALRSFISARRCRGASSRYAFDTAFRHGKRETIRQTCAPDSSGAIVRYKCNVRLRKKGANTAELKTVVRITSKNIFVGAVVARMMLIMRNWSMFAD